MKYSFKQLYYMYPFLVMVLAGTPFVAAGATNQGCSNVSINTLSDIFQWAICLISNTLIPFLFAVALLVFIWGAVTYVAGGSDEGKREQGRKFLLWGIISLFVMVSVWGFVQLLVNTTGIGTFALPQLQ